MRRWLDDAIAGALLLLLAVWSTRWLDVTAYPIVLLQTTGPFVALGLGLLLVGTALLRRKRLLVPVGAATLAAVVLAVPGFRSQADPGATRALTAMSADMAGGAADATQVMDAVRLHAVDVLVLLRVTPDAVRRLDAAGLSGYLRHRVGAPVGGGGAGTILLSRYPLTGVPAGGTSRGVGRGAGAAPEATVEVGGVRLRVKAVSVPAAASGSTSRWRSGLRAVAQWRASRPASEALLLLGDFNAATGHPAFREAAEGLQDAQRAAGGGWVRTWPFAGHRMPPWVQLDHVLSRGLVLTDAGQVAVHGTEHALVWGAYAVTRGG